MSPSPALLLLRIALLTAIQTATNPETPTAEYVKAARDARRVARQCGREVAAIESRDELNRLMGQAKWRTAHREPERNATYGTPGHWTGD